MNLNKDRAKGWIMSGKNGLAPLPNCAATYQKNRSASAVTISVRPVTQTHQN